MLNLKHPLPSFQVRDNLAGLINRLNFQFSEPQGINHTVKIFYDRPVWLWQTWEITVIRQRKSQYPSQSTLPAGTHIKVRFQLRHLSVCPCEINGGMPSKTLLKRQVYQMHFRTCQRLPPQGTSYWACFQPDSKHIRVQETGLLAYAGPILQSSQPIIDQDPLKTSCHVRVFNSLHWMPDLHESLLVFPYKLCMLSFSGTFQINSSNCILVQGLDLHSRSPKEVYSEGLTKMRQVV